MNFVDYELRQGKERPAVNALLRATSASDAGSIMSRLYERPKDDDGAKAAMRAQMASGIDSAAQASPQTSKLEVTIHMPGAPHGTRASVHSNGDILATGQIGHSLLLGPSV
ncbi:hypothetical protein BG58_31405 [Caballeronia jiangsuensis]|nr:hypothetical protein BG58_31405 [Caballeronia jiangsuensis]